MTDSRTIRNDDHVQFRNAKIRNARVVRVLYRLRCQILANRKPFNVIGRRCATTQVERLVVQDVEHFSTIMIVRSVWRLCSADKCTLKDLIYVWGTTVCVRIFIESKHDNPHRLSYQMRALVREAQSVLE